MPRHTTARNRRACDQRSAATRTTTRAAATRPAVVPEGTATAAPGKAAACSATPSNHHSGGRAHHSTHTAASTHRHATTAPTAPITVITPTTGATRALAATATRLTRPDRATISGSVTTNAAADTARISAGTRGHRRSRNQSAQLGASRINPPVAITDSANPALTASSGATASNPITAPHRAGSACLRRPVSSARTVTEPIAAARSTLGSGRARITNTTTAPAAVAALVRGPAVRTRVNPSSAVSRIVKLAPLTTQRCCRPAVSKASLTSLDNAAVSPTTSAGSRPAASGGSARAAASARSARTPDASRCHHGGSPMRSGSVIARSVATVRSARSGSLTVPRNRITCPGTTFAHCSPAASTTSEPPPWVRCTPLPNSRRPARRIHRRSPPNEPARICLASSEISATTVTVRPNDSRSGCACT